MGYVSIMFVDQEFDYYYGEQIRTVINQFAQVFSELYVTVGKNDNNSMLRQQQRYDV